MKCEKKYFRSLDIIRIVSCIGVLLYHLNILKGGYLAVCVFFVLSGYLACASAFKKEKFSIFTYYLNRIKNIYLPLLIVVFISILAVSIFSDINWINLKPETNSVLLGYNNFWQLSANLDYFARHINSPFIHLWYIAILLQFELVFPLLFKFLKLLGDKLHKIIPCLITGILGILSIIYFYKSSLSGNTMVTYYHTFARAFSILLGLLLGLIQHYYKNLIPKFLITKSKVIFYIYLLIVIALMFLVNSSSPYFAISMLGVTLITLRLIDYGTINSDNSKIDKVFKGISGISYEIYLLQYPIIFLSQYIAIQNGLKITLVILITVILSFILHYSLSFKKKNKTLILKILLSIIILSFAICGLIKYIKTEDHTEEMNKLEAQLDLNEKIMQEKQKEYANKLKEEEDKWNALLEDLENSESKIEELVNNLTITGIGDSVMLGAINDLYEQFPNGYFDAKTSRTAWVANGILKDLKQKRMLGEVVLFNLGANGDCSESCKAEIMKTIGNRKVFWLNTTNDSRLNERLNTFAQKYDNLNVIDWALISKNHPEYFIADKIHLTATGRDAYAKAIYDNLYQVYLDEYNKKKEELINNRDNALKNKFTFFGNNILINAFEKIQTNFVDANFITQKEFNYELLKNDVESKINDNKLTNKLVFIFDKNMNITVNEYEELINLCHDKEIYILSTKEDLSLISYDNVKILNFYKEIMEHPEYLMVDRIHLSEVGNEALVKLLSDELQEKVN